MPLAPIIWRWPGSSGASFTNSDAGSAPVPPYASAIRTRWFVAKAWSRTVTSATVVPSTSDSHAGDRSEALTGSAGTARVLRIGARARGQRGCPPPPGPVVSPGARRVRPHPRDGDAMTAPATVAPARSGTRSPWAAMTVVMAGTVMVGLDTTIVSVALHPIGEDLHATSGVEWVVTSSLLALAASQPMTGWLADRF